MTRCIERRPTGEIASCSGTNRSTLRRCRQQRPRSSMEPRTPRLRPRPAPGLRARPMPISGPTITAPDREPQASDQRDSDAARELADLRTRFEELQHERDHLVAVVDILQAISGSVHFSDILQTIARQLGETFGLDRSSIFL